MAAIYTSPRFSEVDDNGRPLAGGRLYTYENGTTTPAPSYKDAAGTILNTNPIILDARGSAVIFLDSSKVYTFVLRNRFDSLIWTQNDVQWSELQQILGPVGLGPYLRDSVERVVNSVAVLRTISKNSNHQVRTLGYYTPGDDGDGVYYYDAADVSTADNGGTVIVATDGGRWKLMPGPFSVKQFGARGNDTASDDAAFSACFAAGATYTGGCEIQIPTGRYLLKNTILWDQRRVRVTCGKSAILNFSTATTEDMWALQYIGDDPVERGDFNTWTGGEFFGPPASTGVNGLRVAAPGTDSSGSFVSYVRVSVTGFDKQIGIGDNVSFCNFIETKLRTLGGPNYQTETGVCIIGVNNMGEAITFTSPQLGGLKYGILNDFGGVADGLIFIAPGIDYCKQAIVLTAPIGVNLTGGHFECQDMALPAFVANGNGCTIEWERPAMWVLHNPINGYFCKATGTTLGGIFFKRPFFQFPAGFLPTTYALTDPDSDGMVIWSDVRGYAGQTSVPGGLPQTMALYRTNDARFQTLVPPTDGADGSLLALDAVTTFRGLSTTRIDTALVGSMIKRQIKIRMSRDIGIPAMGMMIRANGFTTSVWSIGLALTDEAGNAVFDFGSIDNQSNSPVFKLYNWWLQGRTQGTSFAVFTIYAGPQVAGETLRTLNIADVVVNML